MMLFTNKHYWALMNKLAKIEAAVVPSPEQLDPRNHIIFYSNYSDDEQGVLVTIVLGRRELSQLLESQELKEFLQFLSREFGLSGEGRYSQSLLQTILGESETETNMCPRPDEDFEYWDDRG